MATKLKNNLKAKAVFVIVILVVLSIVSVCFFPDIAYRAKKRIEAETEQSADIQEVNTDLLTALYHECFVLYLEAAQWNSDVTAEELFYTGNLAGYEEEINSMISGWQQEFEIYSLLVDYYCYDPNTGEHAKNTSRSLENAVSYGVNKEETNMLVNEYSDIFQINFDEKGAMSVEGIYSINDKREDLMIKTLLQISKQSFDFFDEELSQSMKNPSSFSVIYAIPRTSSGEISLGDVAYTSQYYTIVAAYREEGATTLYITMLVMVALLVLFMTSKRMNPVLNRPGKWYLMEAAFLGIIFAIAMCEEGIIDLISDGNSFDTWSEKLTWLSCSVISLFAIYGIWYLSLRFIRPVFTLGVKEYICQYSFLYQIYPWTKEKCHKLKEEIAHIDFSDKSIKTIMKLVVINFIILAVISTMWVMGVFVLAVYSIGLFFFLQKYYKRIGKDYQTLLHGINRIAEGDLNTAFTEDVGAFEPLKEELEKVRFGFKRAVEEEVKSQRMKTELITNVSHDLKTPLTAITTYVELLKREDITEEERKEYVETLERKSLRLKVLIEDLFEVSKATSNNISLNLVEVDVVNLLKQVSVEHMDKFEQRQLELRWRVPEEKVTLTLDPQKTYRIFENLFVNIQKYAMQGSRVYIEVDKEKAQDVKAAGFQQLSDKKEFVQISIKNMSAEELNISPEELTERFVRGDSARNTEGSGLGLAIAKSFTEAQGGKLSIAVDGDLFKVVILWSRD